MADDRTASLRARRDRLLGPGLPPVLRRAAACRARRGRLADRRRGRPLSRRLQQRRLGRALPSACRRRPGAAGGGAEHPHPLSLRRRARLCRAAAGDLPARDWPCDVHLHRQRGQRPGPAGGAHRHRRHRRDRHRLGLSRRHRGAGGDVALARQRGPDRRPCPPGRAARQLSRAGRCRPGLRRPGDRGDRGHAAGTASCRRRCWSTPSSPATASSPIPPASWLRPRRRCGRPAGWSSPTRCSPASAAPAACGASPGTASFPTWSPWASRWATATRSPAWRRGRRCWRSSAGAPAISTPSAATRSRPRSAWRCWT